MYFTALAKLLRCCCRRSRVLGAVVFAAIAFLILGLLVPTAQAQSVQVFINTSWVHSPALSQAFSCGVTGTVPPQTLCPISVSPAPQNGNISNDPEIQFADDGQGRCSIDMSAARNNAYIPGTLNYNVCNSQVFLCAQVGITNNASGPVAINQVEFEVFRYVDGANPNDPASTPPLRTFFIDSPGSAPAATSSLLPDAGDGYCVMWDASQPIQGGFGKINGQYGFRVTVATNQQGASGPINITQTRSYPSGFTQDANFVNVSQKAITVDVTDVHVIRSTPTVVGQITGVSAEPYNFTYRLSKDATMYFDILQSTPPFARVRSVITGLPRTGEGVLGAASTPPLLNGDSWDGRDSVGNILPPGNYLAVFQADSADQYSPSFTSPTTKISDLSASTTMQVVLDPLQITDIQAHPRLGGSSLSLGVLSYQLTEPATVYMDIYPIGTQFCNDSSGIPALNDVSNPVTDGGALLPTKNLSASLDSCVTTSVLPIRSITQAQPSRTPLISYWDGRDANGNLIGNGDYMFVIYAALSSQAGLPYKGNSSDRRVWTSVAKNGFISVQVAATPLAAAFASVGQNALTANWTANGNPADIVYRVQLSTEPSFSLLTASAATNALSASFAGLSANTTYYGRVAALSANTGVYTPFTTLGSTITLAVVPVGTTVLSVTSTTVEIAWSGNGNPTGTVYELWRDAAAAFASPAKVMVTRTSFVVGGLTPNSTYFFRMRAVGFGGEYTIFDSVLSSVTLPPPPAAPVAPAGTALGVASITWSWPTAQYASFYRFYRASSQALLGSTSAQSFLDVGLATNTAYGLTVGGNNVTGAGPLSLAATAYTLAMPPTNSTWTAVYATSATLRWTLNTNPVGTLAEVQRSTDGVAYVPIGSPITATNYVDNSLLACTTYHFRVRNQNGDGILTPFDSPVQLLTSNTIPLPASGLTATAIGGNRIDLSWTPSPTESITGYDLFYDSGTGAVDYSAPLAALDGSVTSYLSAVMTSSGSYTFALRAKHGCMGETTGVYATAAATMTLTAVRASIQTPVSGHHVDGNSLSVVATLTSGSLSQVHQVLFQYRVNGATTAWISMIAADANHANPAIAPPFFIHWNAHALPAGAYDLRAIATDISGGVDAVPDVVTVVVDPVAADTKEDLAAGKISRTQIFNTAVTNNFFAGGDNVEDPLVKVVIPPGAVTGSTVSAAISLVDPLSISTNPPAGFSIMGNMLMRINLSNGQSQFVGGNTARINFSYSGSLGGNPQIWALNENTGVWSRDFTTTVDAEKQLISGNSPHFTVFAVLAGGAAADLSGVRVYPIPYKPNGGDANQGGGSTGIFFDNLPASASVKIYTPNGSLVTSFDASSSTGKIVWDARNDSGRDVATGLYVAVISSPGYSSVTKKILIVR